MIFIYLFFLLFNGHLLIERQTDRDGETETDKQTDNERETDTVKSLILHSVLFFLSYVDGVFKYKYLSVTRICRRVKFLKRLDLDLKSPCNFSSFADLSHNESDDGTGWRMKVGMG